MKIKKKINFREEINLLDIALSRYYAVVIDKSLKRDSNIVEYLEHIKPESKRMEKFIVYLSSGKIHVSPLNGVVQLNCCWL